MTNKNIRCYSTWKKNNNPVIYQVQDGIKGWAIQTVCPTIEHYGWKQCVMDADYGICDSIKPKELASKLLNEIWGENWIKDKKFVYYVYHGINGYLVEESDLLEHKLTLKEKFEIEKKTGTVFDDKPY